VKIAADDGIAEVSDAKRSMRKAKTIAASEPSAHNLN
jgi:hypothetical protein